MSSAAEKSLWSRATTGDNLTTNSNSKIISSDNEKYLIGASIGAVITLSATLVYKYWANITSLITGKRNTQDGKHEVELLKHVFNRAALNNPDSVLAVIDSFCYQNHWMMNIGDKKGKILQNEVMNKKPKVAVELGGYCGYSAVSIGKLLPADGHLYSIELNPFYAALATKIIEFAGLKDKVTVIVGTIETRWKYLQNECKVNTIDLLFLDHWKEAYLPDFRLIESVTGFIKPGTVIVADNVIYPGAPDYLAYIRENKNYKCTHYEAELEYTSNQKDGVEVSVRL